ncbi:MAG TPA: DoxX family protein [Vicinamibacterales bacterium]
MAANREGTGLLALRLCLGVFFLFEGLGKWGWLFKGELLARRLAAWQQGANEWSAWYLNTIAIPGVEVFARLVMLGELCCGLALLAGVFTRTAAALGFLMVLNFHVASGALFRADFLTNGYGLPVLGGLLALAIGGARLPWSLR